MHKISIFSKEKGVSVVDGKLVTDPNKKYIGHFDVFFKSESEYKIQGSLLVPDYPRSRDFFYEIEPGIDSSTLNSIVMQLLVNLKHKIENGDNEESRLAQNWVAVIERTFNK